MSGTKFRCSIVFVALIALIAVAVYCISLARIETDDGSKAINTTGPRVDNTLKFIAVISRHGNRGPLSSFPNNLYPVNDTNYWPYGVAELTAHGRIQMYNLGMKIRSLYNGFLKNSLYSTDLHATTTLVERTMLSGETFLAGLYPPSGFQIWNKWIPWQPVPLYTDSQDKSQLVSNCPRFEKYQNVSATAFEKKFEANITSINNIIALHTGFNESDFLPIFDVWDTFLCASVEGYILPYWTKQVFPEPMNTLIGESFIAFYTQTVQMTRLLLGKFFGDMMEVMNSKVNGTLSPDRQIYYYSGHDCSLLALQVILGIQDDAMIKLLYPASAIVLELHQDPITKDYTIEVLFLDGRTSDLVMSPIKIPGCDVSCNFSYVVNITKQYWENVDFERDCQLNSSEFSVSF